MGSSRASAYISFPSFAKEKHFNGTWLRLLSVSMSNSAVLCSLVFGIAGVSTSILGCG